MPIPIQKAAYNLSIYSGKIWVALFFVIAFTTQNHAEPLEIGNKDSLTVVSGSENNKTSTTITGKIYVVEGTVISNLKNNSSEIIYIKEKAKINQTSKKQKSTKSNKKRHKQVKTDESKKPKITTQFFQSKNDDSSVLLKSGNGIKSVIPVPTTLVKSFLFKSNFKQKKLLILSDYIHNQKIQFPFFLTMEKSQLYSNALTVRPPPAIL